jgi:DeoR/GlpR family transcriptional regulator of sugar metabolism
LNVSERGLATRDRRESIRDLLTARDYVSTRELAERFGLSDMSVRRDLEALSNAGVLTRVRGGAIPNDEARSRPSLRPRPPGGADDRHRIGAKAGGLLPSGSVVFVDAGWTTLETVSAIPADVRTGITVVTHSLPVLEVVSRWPNPRLVTLAGFFVAEQRMFAGPQTLQTIEGLHADVALIGCDGLSADGGLTTPHQLAGEVIAAMVARAHQVIVVAESFKIGRRGFTQVAPTDRIDTLVTDSRVDADHAAALRGRGVEVIPV